MDLAREDIDRLRYAKELLENPGLAAKLTHLIGMPVEKVFNRLPAKWNDVVQDITRKSLKQAMDAAIRTIDHNDQKSSRDRLHRILVAVSGGVGGAFGLPALAVELPATTILMFRSIVDIARSEGENVHAIDTKLACLEVFALGGRSDRDDGAESGYYAVRALLARQVSEAARYVVERGLAEEGAPALVRLIATIASRFGVNVSQKAAASAVPLIGAAGGALINSIFMDHFQKMARGHFIIRSLERTYGPDEVSNWYGCI